MGWLRELLAQNQFLSGGLLLGIVGGLIAYCRRLPLVIWNWLIARLVLTAEVLSKDDAFDWLSHWLAGHPYAKRARRLTVRSVDRDGRTGSIPDCGTTAEKLLQFIPGTGFHWLRFRGCWFVISRDRKDTMENGWSTFRDTFEIRTWVWNRSKLVELLAEAQRVSASPDGVMDVMSAQFTSWQRFRAIPARSTESVILADGLLESVLEDMRRFDRSRNWYADMGIPYRRGYLFHGAPGNGKTSLAVAATAALRRRLCILSLRGPNMDDERLLGLVRTLPSRSTLLLEDLDCVGLDRESVSKGVTLSGILDALDGAVSPEGQIVIITTNHPEQLDEAIKRPGRVDMEVEFADSTRSQRYRLFCRFYGDEYEETGRRFADGVPVGTSMAVVQQLLMRYRDDPAALVAALETESVSACKSVNVQTIPIAG